MICTTSFAARCGIDPILTFPNTEKELGTLSQREGWGEGAHSEPVKPYTLKTTARLSLELIPISSYQRNPTTHGRRELAKRAAQTQKLPGKPPFVR